MVNTLEPVHCIDESRRLVLELDILPRVCINTGVLQQCSYLLNYKIFSNLVKDHVSFTMAKQFNYFMCQTYQPNKTTRGGGTWGR